MRLVTTSTTSTPREPFKDVGSLRAHELFAFAGLVPQMPENITEVLTIALMRSAMEFDRDAAGFDLMALHKAADCRAILEAMETDRG